MKIICYYNRNLKMSEGKLASQIEEYNKNNPDQHTSVECLTFEEIKERYGEDMYEKYFNRSLTSESDKMFDDINGYINHIVEEKQTLEALILSWRMKLQDYCQDRANALRQGSEWHQYDDEEFEVIRNALI